MQNDDADKCNASFKERAHLEESEGYVDHACVLDIFELSGENGLNQSDYRDDNEQERSNLPWLLNVIVDVSKEDKANARADHDTVLEVVADRGVSRSAIRQTPLPNVDVLLAQSVKEIERVANQEDD